MSSRDPRYDILFEPLQIGPVITKNRFYQVPHCTGMGWLRPRTLASMRGIKAEGGWGVVCTEYCSIHPAIDDTPYPHQSLWDKGDIESNRLMTDKVHEHGALAGVELWMGGSRSPNLLTRETPLDVGSVPNWNRDPVQSRKMDKADIRELKRWHRNAALRAKEAGFDIVYVYATHQYLLDNFMNPQLNTRTDEYGGSIENRVRLVREIIEETKDAVGDTMAVAVRFAVDDGGGGDANPVIGDKMAMFELLAEIPDLWDINVDDYGLEMGVSRFVREASLEQYVKDVKSKTSKPVVSVGRFTSPDTMASQLKRGVLDLIGAARPSIADPFLPQKIEQGRIEDIRECIGCNICYTGDSKHIPIRCTQNPTMGEEWRRGWHPEKIEPKGKTNSVLIIGAGPAGLEAACALGKRGYHVMLCEATRELGGRVSKESTLPGLGEWARVRDYRIGQIEKLDNVEVYRESKMTLQDVLDLDCDNVAVATGAQWRDDGFGNYNSAALDLGPIDGRIFTPDDIMNGQMPSGRTVVYDDDSFYMGSVIAEKLKLAGIDVVYVTPASMVSAWSDNNGEQERVHRHLIELDVEIVLNHGLDAFADGTITLGCVYSERPFTVSAESLVTVSCRTPNDGLYYQLEQAMETQIEGAPRALKRIGDVDGPGIIAAAVHSGHKYARELDAVVDPDAPAKLDRIFMAGNE